MSLALFPILGLGLEEVQEVRGELHLILPVGAHDQLEHAAYAQEVHDVLRRPLVVLVALRDGLEDLDATSEASVQLGAPEMRKGQQRALEKLSIVLARENGAMIARATSWQQAVATRP